MKKLLSAVVALAIVLTSFSAWLVSAEPGGKIEAESAVEAYNADGTPYTIPAEATTLGGTGGKSFVYTNVPAGRVLSIYYATTQEGVTMTVSLWNGTDYDSLGTFAVPNSTTWENYSYASFYLSKAVPANAKMKITIGANDVNLDYYVMGEARSFVEAERKDHQVVIAENRSEDKNWRMEANENTAEASNGAHQAIFPGSYFVYGAIAKSNKIVVAYASHATESELNVSYRTGTSGDWIAAGVIKVVSTGGWYNYQEQSFALDNVIPVGAQVRIDVKSGDSGNVDYFKFVYERTALVQAEDCDEAYDASGNLLDVDPAGPHLSATGGKSYVYYNVVKANKVTVSYGSAFATTLTFFVQGTDGTYSSVGTITLPANNDWERYTTAVGALDSTIPAGSTVKITVGSNDSNLDSFLFEEGEVIPPAPKSEIEAEDCDEAYDAEGNLLPVPGTTPGGGNNVSLGGTKGRSYVYKNVAAATKIEIAYATTLDNASLKVYVLEGENYVEVGSVKFANTYNWEVFDKATVTLTKAIPSGSTIKIVVGATDDVNLDAYKLIGSTGNPESGDGFVSLMTVMAVLVLTLASVALDSRKRRSF